MFTLGFVIWSVIILILLSAIIRNFLAVLDFKWYIDYFYTKDQVCTLNKWTKFEVESLEYNLVNFIYDIDGQKTFKDIKDAYTQSYAILITFMSVILIILIAYLIYVYSSSLESLTMWVFFIWYVIIYITLVTVNSLIFTKFQEMDKEDSNIDKYHKVYRILNAIINSANIKDDVFEFKFHKLNAVPLTFDQIAERNIASYENLSNTSKIKLIKKEAYKNCDILKYFVFDKYSPYYLKYFDNMYIRILGRPNENLYLTDEHAREEAITSENTDAGKTDAANTNPGNPERIYQKINNEIKSNLQNINVKVNNDDYIKYFLENKDVLFEKTTIITNDIRYNSNYLYAYFIYFALIFLIISHYFYTNTKDTSYVYTILSVIIVYMIFVWIYANYAYTAI